MGEWNYVAFAGDCGEVLLATKYVLDAYGDTLTTSNGYPIKDFGNALYYALAAYCWRGDAYRYFQTEYPYDSMPWGMEGYGLKQKMPFVAAIASQAIYEWGNSAYRTGGDYTSIGEKALDFINCITVGRWGGYLYSPYYGADDENKMEYTVYTAFMAMAMNSVNASKYADKIQACKNFIQWMAVPDGRVYDTVDENGVLRASSKFVVQPDYLPPYWLPPLTAGTGSATTEAWQFIGHDVAVGLLAGA
jgi:hypothetical protein